MDIKRVFTLLGSFLKNNQIAYAVVGGFGLHAYGLSRLTYDIDFAVSFSGQERLIDFLEEQGYETLHRSSGFSNHLHPDQDFGRLDFIFVRGETEKQLFAEARQMAVFPGISMPVPSPEHLIAMKLHALTNDPSRVRQDLADIRFLLALEDLNQAEVERYFERYDMIEAYRELRHD